MLKQWWLSPHFQRWAIPLLIFGVAFGLRMVYPMSRPLVWSDRAVHFVNAVEQRDWKNTYLQYHPGVTVMWLSGVAVHQYADGQGGLTAQQLLGMAPTKPGVLVDSIAAELFPLALVISFCIALTYPLLTRLFRREVAFAAASFMALDPYHIAYSKVVHPDGLLSMFMLVSALFLLLYGQENRWRWLLLSGLFAGLSFLSKSPALFLFPYLGLTLSVIILVKGWQSPRIEWLHLIKWGALSLLVWFVAAAFVFTLLWPAMWVEPLQTLQKVLDGVVKHSGNPHRNPVFFAGSVWETDPGPLFYLATLAWKMTAITFPGVLVSLWVVIRQGRTRPNWPLLAMMAYAFFFFIQMSLGQFKQIAYILPVAPVLDVIAGFGLVWIAQLLAQKPQFSRVPHLSTGIIASGVVLQLAMPLLSYPYFGAHYNYLLGGHAVAQHVLPLQDHGEGLEVAAQFLNGLPHGQSETAEIFARSAIIFRREFMGRTETKITPFARYRIYYINHITRGMGGEEWDRLWLEDQQREPLLIVDVEGLPYVWVYGDPPEDPAPNGPVYEVDYQLGDHIRLEKIRLSDTLIHTGQPFTVVLHWNSDGQISDEYVTFVHLLDENGQLVAQQDNVPLVGVRPTTTWNENEQLEDAYFMQIPATLAPGLYTLSVGMYQAQTIERLPVYDESGNRQQDDRVIVTEIEVSN